MKKGERMNTKKDTKTGITSKHLRMGFFYFAISFFGVIVMFNIFYIDRRETLDWIVIIAASLFLILALVSFFKGRINEKTDQS